jgi:hypothetical protein
MKNILLLLLVFSCVTSSFSQWTQVGGTIQDFSQNSDLVVIGDTPYMSYTDVSAGGKLFVESYDGNSWSVVGTEITTTQAVEVNLELDNADNLHVSYTTTLGLVNVKKFSGGSWTNVGAPDFANAFNLDFTINGSDLYVAFSDGNNFGEMTVMKFSNGSWVTVGNAGFTVFGIGHPSIAVENGVPYVAFQDFNAGSKTTVMKYNDASGNWETVGSPGISMGSAQYNSLKFNNGEAYVAFKDAGNASKATLMKFNTSSNNWENVGSPGFSDGLVEYTKLAFFNNAPYIAYNDDVNSDFTTVKTYNGSEWVSVGASFGTTQCYAQELIISGTTAFCGFIDQTSVVLYSYDLGCASVGVSLTKTDADCNGTATGTATASASNASNPVTYNWSNGTNGATNSNLLAGTYTVTISDNNGCTAEGDITIEEPPILEGAIIDMGNVDCNNPGGGFATVEASGGTPGYSYNWSTGGTSMTELNIPIGTHTVTITDTKGCEESVSVTISGENDTTPPMAITQDLTVALDANGVATISPDMVDNGSSDDCEITNLSLNISQFDCSDLGTVNVILTVTDAGGNMSSQTATITIIDVIDPIIICPANIVSNFCDAPLDFPLPTFSDACGGVVLTQIQGLPSGATFPIGATMIAFTAIDLSGNQANCSFSITVQNDLVIATSMTDVLCFGEDSGSATANVTGGNMPYDYQWDDPNMQTTQIAQNLAPGNYGVIITDDKGCIITGTADVNEPTEVQITIDEVIDETGQNMDGAISITASGGTNSGYTFEWSLNGNPFETLEDLTGLDDGEYCVTVTDANGCSQTACETVDFISNTSTQSLKEYISIYPNPTSDWINIDLDLPNINEVNVNFYDVLGRNVLTGNRSNLSKDHLNFNLSEMNAGIYFLKIEIDEEYMIERIIVE